MAETSRYNLDPELFAEFASEATESLGDVEELLVALENNPEDLEIVQKIFRPVHSMKGNAAFFNLSQTKTLAHDLENVLDRIRKETLVADKTVIDLILVGVDMLKGMIARVQENEPEVANQDAYDGILATISRLLSDEGGGREKERVLLRQATEIISVIREDIGDTLGRDLQGKLEKFIKDYDELQHAASATASASATPAAPKRDSSGGQATPAGDAGDSGASGIKQGLAHKEERQKTIRVSEQKVDDFLEFVSELVILSEGMNQLGIELATTAVERSLRSRFSEINTTFRDLAEGLEKAILSIRMVPAATLTRKLPRMVRDLSTGLSKPARITIDGEEVEIDKSLIEALDSPMTHLIRNSLDHGLETPEERKAAGKGPVGEIFLSIRKNEDTVEFCLRDDGRGIDAKAVRDKAVRNGLIAERDAATMSHEETLQLIFASGLSTAKVVSDVSGRGVGMDVVRTTIEELGGNIKLASEVGKGTTVTLLLPYNITTVVEKVLVVRFGDRQFSIPESMVMEVVRTDRDSGQHSPAGEVIQIRDEIFRVVRLTDVLNIESGLRSLRDGALVLVRVTGQRVAIVVEEVLSLQQVIIRNVDGEFLNPLIVQGIGMHGDGSLSPVLNVVDIVKHTGTGSNGSEQRPGVG